MEKGLEYVTDGWLTITVGKDVTAATIRDLDYQLNKEATRAYGFDSTYEVRAAYCHKHTARIIFSQLDTL